MIPYRTEIPLFCTYELSPLAAVLATLNSNPFIEASHRLADQRRSKVCKGIYRGLYGGFL